MVLLITSFDGVAQSNKLESVPQHPSAVEPFVFC